MNSSKRLENPFFTVVIPTYNREDLIEATLKSVLAQTYSNYEILIVDNASTDRTIQVLKPFLEEHDQITLIKNEKNLERSRARNVGFRAASGDFLTLLDSDDFMYRDSLKDAAEFVKKNQTVNFFHNYYELVDSDWNTLKSYTFPSEKDQIKQLAKGNFISCIGVYISREIYQAYEFNEDEKILGSEDWELWLRVISKYPLKSIEKVNSGVLYHKGRSISAYSLKEVVKRKNYIIDEVLKNKAVQDIFGRYESLMRGSAYLFTAVSANDAKLFNEAKKYLRRAAELWPPIIFSKRFIRIAQIANFKIERNLN
ncbi:MAG: glycosyltransferase family A protein [Vicingaceae bacterium]